MTSRNELLAREYSSTTEQLSTDATELKPIGTTEQLSVEGERTVDRALEQTSDLISPQFKSWYAKQAYRIGADRYLGIAFEARRGRAPAKLFSYMLKKAPNTL